MNHSDRSSEQIQADIQRTRSELDRTLTLLEDRLEPRRIVDQGIDYLRDNGATEYLSNLGRAAKEQPIPLALVGVGLAWMMMTSGRATAGRANGRSVGDAIGAASSAASSRASELGDAMSHALSQTRDAAHRTSQTLSEAADATRARAAQVGEATRQVADKVRSGYDHLVNEQPLALGAIGLALGAVLAAAAPRTRQEDEWMGESSDRLMDDATRVGKGKLRDVQRAVSEAVGASSADDEREDLRGNPLARQHAGNREAAEPALTSAGAGTGQYAGKSD